MDKQIAYRFDKITRSKVLKGLLISMSGGAALAGLSFLGTLDINDPVLAIVVAILVPALVNLVKELIKGT